LNFAGKRNSAETGENIKEAVRRALVSGDFLSAEELVVDVFPLTEHAVASAILIAPVGGQEGVYLSYSFDFRDNKLVPRKF